MTKKSIIGIIITILSLIVIMVLIMNTTKKYKNWDKVDAQIIAYRDAYNNGGSLLNNYKELKYQYSIDGVNYTGVVKTSYKDILDIHILVNPSDYTMSYTETEVTTWTLIEICFFIMIGITVILLLLLGITK